MYYHLWFIYYSNRKQTNTGIFMIAATWKMLQGEALSSGWMYLKNKTYLWRGEIKEAGVKARQKEMHPESCFVGWCPRICMDPKSPTEELYSRTHGFPSLNSVQDGGNKNKIYDSSSASLHQVARAISTEKRAGCFTCHWPILIDNITELDEYVEN